jgi:hypothetical protein
MTLENTGRKTYVLHRLLKYCVQSGEGINKGIDYIVKGVGRELGLAAAMSRLHYINNRRGLKL